MDKSLYREKNLKKATDPEQLDSYLKVTGFGAWFVIIAVALVLLAIVIWAFAGNVYTVIKGAGYSVNHKMDCYFATEALQNISVGDEVIVENTICKVESVDASLYLAYDIPNEILYLLPDSTWYSTVELSTELTDGLYPAQIVIEEQPASFLMKGEES